MMLRFTLPLFAALALHALPQTARAAVVLDLADQPLTAAPTVAGNVALALSVEFPTAISVAHLDTVYNSASTYLGYFSPDKCYVYTFVDVEDNSNKSHFAPAAVASNHQCTGDADHMWSGNYLNWATTQTIDPFRWAMTGGYRVVDTPSLTLLEKAWASGQGGTNNFPDKVVTNADDIAAASPFVGSAKLTAYVQGRGQQVNFVGDGAVGTGGFLATYFNGTNLDRDSPPARPVLTRTESINFDWGNGSPKPGVVNSDNFSVRWVALQKAPAKGTYSFRTTSDAGVKLWVNGQLLINNWTAHTVTDDVGEIKLEAGQDMNIRVEYFENTVGATMKLAWKRPGDARYSVYTAGDYWYVPIRVKACDPDAPGVLEDNCVAYANGRYKPEGLMQKYANKIRYSVFGYLNDSNNQRDGAVLRAAQKFVGPTYPKLGSAATPNPQAEWDADTGVFFTNPDPTSAAATNKAFGTSIANSGAINYVNKFGELMPGDYKSFDPVSELFYASLRYLKNQGNVDSWSSLTGGGINQRNTWADGFPVIANWSDPIQYTCQKNYILGIGDVHSHADKNLPGPTGTQLEPTKPGPADGLMGDTTFSKAINAVTATNKVGELQGLGNTLGTAVSVGSCCGGNSYLMGGLAYDAHTRDIRPDLAGMQTVQTYWLDVLEYQRFEKNNMFYLAAKYGGFTVPDGFDPYKRTAPLDEAWWHTSTDTVGTGADAQPRPDNYFTGGRPDQMVSGLTDAFAKIVDNLSEATSAVSVTDSPNQSVTGASYGSSYSARGWTGDVTGSRVNYDIATDGVQLTPAWSASALLDTRGAADRTIVTCCNTDGTALPFTAGSMAVGAASGKLSSRTLYSSFANVPGVSPASQSTAKFLNYLRGDRSQERGKANGVYRKRDHVLGDIVDSKVLAVGAPEFSYYDSSNPGYSTFKKTHRQRKTVVYAGSNDGMLHAFDGDISAGNQGAGGKELFAFIPSFMYGTANSAGSTGLAALGNPSYLHSFRVNGPLRAVDVNFNQTYGITGSGAAKADGDWRTVLVAGLGKGGKGYVALDVTDPSSWTGSGANKADVNVAKKVLWEFPAPPELATATNKTWVSSARASATMGFSFGDPQIVKTARFGWVALLTSGYNNADGKGYLYVVDIKSGALLHTFTTPEGSVDAPINLAGVTGYIPDPTTALVEAVYGADTRGNVWRFDLRDKDNYPDPVKIAELKNAQGTPQSVTAPVRVVIDTANSNKRYIVIGTGRLLADSDAYSTDTQSIYALLDGDARNFFTDATLPSGFSFPLKREIRNMLQPVEDLQNGASNVALGWYLDLKLPADPVGDIAYRVTLAPFFVNGHVVAAANQPSADPCSPGGKGRLYIVSIDNGKLWSLEQSDSPYVEIADKSIDGNRVVVATTAKGRITSKSAPPGKALRTGRLSWREAPSDE